MRLARYLLLASLLLVAGHFAFTVAVGVLTKAIFSDGAACTVVLKRPKVRYFPLRAQVEDVHIYHRSEGPERGFRADKVSVQLEFSALFRKRVVLNKLSLLGSRVHSIGEQTGFIKTLEFVLQKPAASKKGPPPWHSFLSSGWGVWVQHVEVKTIPDAKDIQVTIGTPEFIARAATVEYHVRDEVPIPGQPVAMSVEGNALALSIAGSPYLPLETFSAAGAIRDGVLTIENAEIAAAEYRKDRQSRALGSGSLHFGEEERYDISISGELFDQYLIDLAFPLQSQLSGTEPRARVDMRLKGPLDRPLTSGNVSLAFDKGAALFLRESCALRDASMHFAASVDGLKITELQIEDIVENASLSLEFSPRLPVEGSAQIEIEGESPFIERCIPSKGIADERRDELAPFSLAVHQALANSLTSIRFEGSLAEQEGSATIESDVYRRSNYAHSKLKMALKLSEQLLQIEAQETGEIPRIGRALRSEEGAPESQFETRDPASAQLKLAWELANGVLNVEQLAFRQYPADRIAARLAPFLSHERYAQLATFFSPESEIDAEVTGQLVFTDPSLRDSRLRGEVVLHGVHLGPLAVQKLHFPFRLQGQGLRSEKVEIHTAGGSIEGELSLGANAALTANFASTQLRTDALRQEYALLSQLDPEVQFELSLSGSLATPKIEATATAKTESLRGDGFDQSVVRISSSDAAYRLTGTLLADSASFDVNWPRDATAELAAELTLESFPIPSLRPPTDGVRPEGYASGSFVYRGPSTEPLKGSGTLEIEKLYWPEVQLKLERGRALRAKIADGRLTLDEVPLSVEDKTVVLRGSLDHERGWDLRAVGNWKLEAIALLVQPLEQVAGDIELALSLTGPFDEPALEGQMTLRDGSLSFLLENSVVGVSSANAFLRLKGDEVLLETFNGSIGQGSIRAEGAVRGLFEPTERETDLAILIDEGRVEPLANLNVQFDARLELSQSGRQPFLLEGIVEVDEARYEKRVELEQMIKAMTRTILGSETAQLEGSVAAEVPLKLDIAFRAPNGLLIETDLGAGELRGAVQVSGPPSELRLAGEVETLSGTFQLGLNTFEILSGELQFKPTGGLRLDPDISLVAETTVETASREQHNVRMSITGTISNPRVRFTSDSGLSENEIVALFGLGGRGLELLSLREQYSFRELLDPRSDLSIRERLVGLTGFRDIHIESGLSEDSGEFVPRVRARRPLIGKSQLEVASELSGEQVSEAEVLYPLSPTLDLTSGWRSQSVTEGASNSSGSYKIGVRYQRNFLGTGIIPRFRSDSKRDPAFADPEER